MRKILVYGCKEFGQIVKNLVALCGYEFMGFIDDRNEGDYVLGKYDWVKMKYPPSEFGIVLAIGYKSMRDRWLAYEKIKTDGYDAVTLIHPKAIVDGSSRIGNGVIIMAGAIVDFNAYIKDLAVLWNGVVVSHDSVVGENSFLSPNATVCGCTSIGRDCFIGAGSVITDHQLIADGSFVRAGGVNAQK